MATTLPVLLLLSGLLFSVASGDDCDSYYTPSGEYRKSQDCAFLQYCCGSCSNRFCCSNPFNKLDDDLCLQDLHQFEQDKVLTSMKSSKSVNPITIGSAIAGVMTIVIFFLLCCLCPCCCLYKMCMKPRPVVTTTTHTTVLSTQYPQQQPLNPGAQYPAYQQIPAQPGYSAQPGYEGQPMPMPAAPYQGQPYAPGPPPPYHESGYPAPYSQAAYDGGQPPYPLQPPTQPGYAHPTPPTDYSATQPAYNPAYVDPPKTGY
ncbi:hypothetical protein SRHO_G00273060 [Serrasalmus rhombeus]